MSMDDIKDGQRINCHGVNGTVIGKRSTRNRRLVLAKMDSESVLWPSLLRSMNSQTV